MKEQNDITPPTEPPSQFAQERAAQIWCEPNTEKFSMIPELCIEFARVIDQYREVLIWCSGSVDFAPNGKASEGWIKIWQALLKN